MSLQLKMFIICGFLVNLFAQGQASAPHCVDSGGKPLSPRFAARDLLIGPVARTNLRQRRETDPYSPRPRETSAERIERLRKYILSGQAQKDNPGIDVQMLLDMLKPSKRPSRSSEAFTDDVDVNKENKADVAKSLREILEEHVRSGQAELDNVDSVPGETATDKGRIRRGTQDSTRQHWMLTIPPFVSDQDYPHMDHPEMHDSFSTKIITKFNREM